MAPIAIQAPLSVVIDLQGDVVNDVFTRNPNYKFTDLHTCIFPLKETTAVLLFIDGDDTKFRKFRKQFNKLDEDSKLGVVNYLAFLYSEDYFLEKDLMNKVNVQDFYEVVNQTPVVWNDLPYLGTEALSEKFTLSKWDSIPNLLLEQYKVR